MKRLFIILFLSLIYRHGGGSEGKPMDYSTMIKDRLKRDYLTSIDRLIHAIRIVESNMNDFAVGSSQDVGPLQITPVRLKDFNQKTGKNYSHSDCFNFEVSKEIFLFYASKYGSTPDKWEMLARRWNRAYQWQDNKGLQYWKRVLTQLNKTI
jgi:hypothetical protein